MVCFEPNLWEASIGQRQVPKFAGASPSVSLLPQNLSRMEKHSGVGASFLKQGLLQEARHVSADNSCKSARGRLRFGVRSWFLQ